MDFKRVNAAFRTTELYHKIHAAIKRRWPRDINWVAPIHLTNHSKNIHGEHILLAPLYRQARTPSQVDHNIGFQPKIVIKLGLKPGQPLLQDQWCRWLRNVPANVENGWIKADTPFTHMTASEVPPPKAMIKQPDKTELFEAEKAYEIESLAHSMNIQLDAQAVHDNQLHAPSYSPVNVLLLTWERNDLNNEPVTKNLMQVFEDRFGYDTELWTIPRHDSLEALRSKVTAFSAANDAEENLMIVYYNGHGDISTRGHNYWQA